MELKKIRLLDIDYITVEDKPVIRLFGRESEDNTHFIVYDKTFKPYFYAIPHDLDAAIDELKNMDLSNIKILTRKELRTDIKLIKIILNHPKEVPKLRDDILDLDSIKEIREHDIPFYRRYLIDKNIVPMSEIEIIGNLPHDENSNDNVTIMELKKDPKISDSSFPNLNILAFDIEVRSPDGMPTPEENEIIMISIAGNCGENKVISTKDSPNLDYVEKVDTEAHIIKRFIEYIRLYKPDIIVGYNSDNFDFTYIDKRAKILNVKLDLGIDSSKLRFIKRGFTEAADIKGIIHVDLYLVMRRYMNLDRYTLERVYLELFGKEKFDLPGDKLWQYWDNNGEALDELFKYSLDDVITTYEIAEKILPLNMELTRVVGQPLFDMSRMTTGQQVEWFLTRKSYEKNILVPNKPSGQQFAERKGTTAGGYVKEPEKGLHENLIQFDFRSLYPSLIISKNISPDTLIKKDKPTITNTTPESPSTNDDCYTSPEFGYKFLKEPQGFIPSVIGEVLNERIRIKKQMENTKDPTEKKMLNVQQEALKRLANTMYGAYGYSRFRWYSLECAKSITSWGRDYIKKTMKEAENYGFKTIYADTDGFYVKYI